MKPLFTSAFFLACGIAAAGALLQWMPGSMHRLAYVRAALAQGEWWRLLTGQLLHLNAAHWLANAAALLLLTALFSELHAKQLAGFLCASAAAVAVGLWFAAPQVAWYVGLSGALHGVYAAGAAARLRGACTAHDPARAGWAALLWLAGAAKLGWEATGGWPVAHGQWLDIPIVPAAHAFGFAGGTLAGCRPRRTYLG